MRNFGLKTYVTFNSGKLFDVNSIIFFSKGPVVIIMFFILCFLRDINWYSRMLFPFKLTRHLGILRVSGKRRLPIPELSIIAFILVVYNKADLVTP